ncbi:pirin family protein [Methyloversatilis sp. XJ19-13]|uniref:pirin family protein n=1 Tax=Methyloversatilis sp. XJ19-13 TaxID=2963430 RepID=UPI00211C1E95|nr:pirin family protein [Methyloversatilis sp. XJ19-13]MCQ9373498.1 pirin family protein [Methyloversatilis sp. XJ19-13]
MISLRKSSERGFDDHGWGHSHFSFSFADYHDPDHMGFGVLRALMEDTIAPGGGFGTHPHRDMEIVTVVLAGELTHRDSMGHTGVLRAGDVQRMSAGHGVLHSEWNHGRDDTVRMLQIWLLPEARGIAPDYAQAHFPAAAQRGRLQTLVHPPARDGALGIHSDVALLAMRLDAGDAPVSHPLVRGRKAYVHLVDGALTVNGQRLQGGDALKLDDETEVKFENGQGAHVLLFDLGNPAS